MLGTIIINNTTRRGIRFLLVLSIIIFLAWFLVFTCAFSIESKSPSSKSRLSSYTFDNGQSLSSPRPNRSQHRWQTKSSLLSASNSNINSDIGDIFNGGKTLSTQQIMYPEIYLSEIQPLPTTTDSIPLFAAMQSITKSLEKIITASSTYMSNREMTDDESTLLSYLDSATILRIEESISAEHTIDPLCWLHAQQSSIRNLRYKLTDGKALPVIYFGDAEGQVESAVIGKASDSYSDSWDPFVGKRIWDDNVSDDIQHQHSMFKESDLPPRARVYGGSRFDWKFYQGKMRNENSLDADDWDGFGGDRGGYWILPGVELRREAIDPYDVFDSSSNRNSEHKGAKKLTLAIHLHNCATSQSLDRRILRTGWYHAAKRTLGILQELSDQLSPAVPCTTLPPVITRSESTGKSRESGSGDGDPGYIFERGVTEALRQITSPDIESSSPDNALRKVVLARKVDLNLGSSVSGLDVLLRLKFGGHIGHIFYLNPGDDEAVKNLSLNDGMICSREFLGCTPERLFRVKSQDGARMVISEALAGTRIRGLTPAADAELLQELLLSKKDILENEITGKFISDALQKLENNGWLQKNQDSDLLKAYESNGIGNELKLDDGSGHHRRFFVRRLRHLQHICQTFEGQLSEKANIIDVSRSLLSSLHPTPAVCGDSPDSAFDFIRKYETLASYDRGFYAGPFGYIGHDSADVVVAIRSGLVTNYHPKLSSTLIDDQSTTNILPESKISVFAGAGIVNGSTVQGEWTETSHKLGVISSLFPSSPITLQSYSSPNVGWSSAFIEEFVRCGVTTFYICPGSRNTPLTTAIFKATRSNIGIVRAISVHDERGAGFRALGYARQHGRPAAVVTSSGTAVANLYPSVVEASSDGIPLLLLTADRPYESRDTGSNQSIDQVKIFSSSYVRWFRDIPSPSDDVPVSLALSDANHAISLSKQLMGPVHLNIQFRENLAPDDGPIRNDGRIGSVTKFHNARFTDVPGFARWSLSGKQWMDVYARNNIDPLSVREIAELIMKSTRGIIVMGNLRSLDDTDNIVSTVSHFAQTVGFPIFAGIQSGAVRKELPSIPYADYLLKNPLISKGIQPDLILQIGSPLISTEVSSLITNTIKQSASTKHVLVQHLHPHERADPDQTITHCVSTSIGPFLKSLIRHLHGIESTFTTFGSELAPLMHIGKKLRTRIPSIITSNLDSEFSDQTVAPVNGERKQYDDDSLTEPQIMQAIVEVLAEPSSRNSPMSLFLSNSMPVRDGELFLYPSTDSLINPSSVKFPLSVFVNRGASGIDGIISTAIGCGDSFSPTTLVCGDVTTLHDLNALYGLTFDHSIQPNASNMNRISLTTVVVNNGGGAIFSFLPIAKHGQDVGFEEFWGTPTNKFSFEQGASAFGLPYKCASSFESFKNMYRSSILSGGPTIIEAKVTTRAANVDVHQNITRRATDVVNKILNADNTKSTPAIDKMRLPIKQYKRDVLQPITKTVAKSKTLLLIHGWMGEKYDWDYVANEMSVNLSPEWNIIAIDLPGHGESPIMLSSDIQIVKSSLGLDSIENNADVLFSLDMMAETVCLSLIHDHQIMSIDAIAGYSLGGRIALAMKRLCSLDASMPKLVTDQTQLILLGSDPRLPSESTATSCDKIRVEKDHSLARSLALSSYRSYLIPEEQDKIYLRTFLSKWYRPSLWGNLRHRNPDKYKELIGRRLTSLIKRRHDIAAVLKGCSPPLNSQEDWKVAVPSKTLFVAGELDQKYSSIGQKWQSMRGIWNYVEVENAGHALLVEDPVRIATIVGGFVSNEILSGEKYKPNGIQHTEVDIESILERNDTSGLRSHALASMEYESFGITMMAADGSDNGVLGVGWGESARTGNELKRREGFIISLSSSDGVAVGLGEVSPLKGLHKESLEKAELQLEMIKEYFAISGLDASFYIESILSLDGSLTELVEKIFLSSGIERTDIAQSVKSGLEMAILSVASQISGYPLPQALTRYYDRDLSTPNIKSFDSLPINSVVTRGSTYRQAEDIVFPSIKVKVGDKDASVDVEQLGEVNKSTGSAVKLRADANRAWNLQDAQAFALEIQSFDRYNILSAVEFIEEPLEKQHTNEGSSLEAQVNALEKFTHDNKIPYALDESLVELAEATEYRFDQIASDLRKTFSQHRSGCAAFVLKPTMLGIELSMQIAKLAHQEFQIPVIFSSSFDSGIGLSYMAILAAVCEHSPHAKGLTKYAHGLGTFTMLGGDTLSPPFKSYVNKNGLLNVASLSRSLFGLSLDEISSRLPMSEVFSMSEPTIASADSETYLARTSSSTGRDITVSVSMPLPFSDGIASSRFTDLPQMSRWSPWLNSVTYLDAAGLTEWNLNIKGVKFSWKAQSEVLQNPRGIKWSSISGLRNSGVVEFEPVSDDACIMKLKMSIIMPYILVTLFQGMPSVVQDFLQNKLLKWSLEMFRDVVKADLAVERGDNELGDALFGAVEGRANALEEALRR